MPTVHVNNAPDGYASGVIEESAYRGWGEVKRFNFQFGWAFRSDFARWELRVSNVWTAGGPFGVDYSMGRTPGTMAVDIVTMALTRFLTTGTTVTFPPDDLNMLEHRGA